MATCLISDHPPLQRTTTLQPLPLRVAALLFNFPDPFCFCRQRRRKCEREGERGERGERGETAGLQSTRKLIPCYVRNFMTPARAHTQVTNAKFQNWGRTAKEKENCCIRRLSDFRKRDDDFRFTQKMPMTVLEVDLGESFWKCPPLSTGSVVRN